MVKAIAIEKPNWPVFVDEMGCYFGGQNDGLKEDLRLIDGVPNATYEVKDGLVFVFDKLVHMVVERRTAEPDTALDDLARSLIADAMVTAKDAVETWGVVPEPYEMAVGPEGDLMIRHRPLNARLPGSFRSEVDVQCAFANLLLGGIEPGVGDFVYRGQPLMLCDPLDTALLPPRPTIQHVEKPERPGYTPLGNVSYEPGFQPVSKALFDEVKVLASAWSDDSARVSEQVQYQAGEIWSRVQMLSLDTLDGPFGEVPEYGQEDLLELRSLYPELSMLPDSSLYSWFDEYQSECCQINGWAASRDNGFLFYLLGKVAGQQHEQETAKDVGEWAAYALLRNDSLDASLAFGRAAALYTSAMYQLALRIADAMRFVAVDRLAATPQGGAVTTMMDMLRWGRKVSATSHAVEQKLSEFEPGRH